MDLKTAQQAAKIAADVTDLQRFIESIEMRRNDPIKNLYIVTQSNYRIEIKKRFSIESNGEILNIILKSRKALLSRLIKTLKDMS
ncbi:MAG: hypothetical protein IPM51_12130 [Sphingobacteriaceae bacterium]|nr:hypothetical protein [Sphingobacteriaceae bacterium]